MLDPVLPELTRTYGRDAAASLAEAYDAAIRSVSLGSWSRMPDRSVRLAMVEQMLREGRRNGFDPARLRRAALGARPALSPVQSAAVA